MRLGKIRQAITKASTIALCALFLFGCTHGRVSSVPEVINNQYVFTYQGRANFSHQMAEADKQMQEKCSEFNGGTPVAVTRDNEDLGYVVSGSNAMGNQNQIVKFICKAPVSK